MNINLPYLFVLIFMISLIVLIFMCIKKKYEMDNIVLIFSAVCPILFSALGVLITDYNNEEYFVSYLFFVIFMILTIGILIKGSNKFGISKLNLDIIKVLKENKKTINILGYIALFLQLTLLIYPEFKLFDLFTPNLSSYAFRGREYFSTRLFTRTDSISQVLSILRTSFMPFFFIMLYNHKDNPKFVIFMYVFYYYINYINEYYLQRNKIIMMIFFILFYLFFEKKITKKTFTRITIFLIPFIFILSSFLGQYRTYGTSEVSIGNSINNVLLDESKTQRYLSTCESIYGTIFFPKMVYSIVTAPLFFLPDDFPVLSYLFTEKIIGQTYGSKNYYILLPCSYGEALMVMGRNFAFLYAIFFGFFFSIVYNFLKKNAYAKYYLLYIVLNFAASFRGGLQNFMLQTINMLTAFIIITLFVGIFKHNFSKNR